jgi:hypothetical protein
MPKNDASELTMPRLVVIVGPTEPDAAQLFAFGDALLQSAWLTAVGKDYGVGAKAGATSLHLTGAAVPATMDGTALRQYVNDTITANPAAAADGNTIYVFFYPPGTGRGDSCADLGAHGTLGTAPYAGLTTDALAWAQRCPAPAGMSDLDALTITASHEVLEVATDLYPPHGYAMPDKLWAFTGTETPWEISSWSYYQGGAVEVGDLCEGTILEEGGVAYQRIWSTSAAAKGGDPCVPAIAEPYYSASAPADWVVLAPGTTASVPITGFSTGPRGDWYVTVYYGDTYGGDFKPTFGGSKTTTLNAGCTATLSVTTPAASGAFGVFKLVSSESPPDPSTGIIPLPASGDQRHVWTFGVRTTCDGCAPLPSCGDGTCDTATGETCASCPDDCGACGAVCGASNFGVPCGTSTCPTHASCQSEGGCACDIGYTASTCDGVACSGASCVDPSWWCVPAACGAANFVTECAGNFTCPADATCGQSDSCYCAPGTVTSTCDGQPCPSGGCSYPDYWCTVCGAPSGPVACSGYTCPAFSTCGASNSCDCQSGYSAVSCTGEPCDGSNCPGGHWWCFAGE